MKNTSENLLEQLASTQLLPLYTVNNLTYLDKLEHLLVTNDIRFIEVTFRTKLVLPAIEKLSASGNLIVGAGTVRTLAEAKAAVEHGAKFIVSPVVIPEVIAYCLENDILIVPGVATPSDIQKAVECGIKTVKFFPADIYGGLNAINALSGPYYDVNFLPTGGINQKNFCDYLNNEKVIAVGGSFIISEKELMQENNQLLEDKLTELLDKLKNK
ncbi:bifunctional 4-hydroxy-2-oxoglutarate aldolase/2-dehydro-3-deoxy-phosphogluconate aldolase [Vagococcus zengguangii]|uniref:Bifunctional 4-hydroxy-2-oxoglutarate aldolase/2-dehydro-3-deoxy-phosphogluconate aldolase n=1 Tax=Vagococcus zengguangii TaxID=2571750 RepID=A0A4D7CN79_9ENTE|nr:bifunctional 4-hydroxy-2-oxoglutarate aldolase/2-dehydro-3-deoxy-phosphogluconate aldolase [Vagococcus zengguangii]QCI85559.1 bifunctional 4-hydroxy-2-oxoglutarate aldolase/2-dehydro-3-deoxy-phosphogluconate aldolase [Vagococcus zengguangii]TLG79412.1 bifunctional 4-hydroxy-2-oxoglutarate aldolase/2-dehydro-3-deoxy-phosphogluconate aldolase [Vagococcus zengguangii]